MLLDHQETAKLSLLDFLACCVTLTTSVSAPVLLQTHLCSMGSPILRMYNQEAWRQVQLEGQPGDLSIVKRWEHNVAKMSESRLCVNLTRRCAYCLDHREIAKRLSQMLLVCPGVSLLIFQLLVFPCRNDSRVMEGRGAGRRWTEAIRKTTWKLEHQGTVGA